MTERFQVMRLDEIDGYADEGRPRWHMIRAVLGIESFGVNAWRATEAGQAIIGEHDELGQGAGGHEELYFVLSGRATFTVDGEPVPAPAGSLVFVKDPRRAAQRRRRRGRHDRARDRRPARRRRSRSPPGNALPRRCASGRPVTGTARSRCLQAQLVEDPENANVLYNLACAESRGGRLEPAVSHLARAVELEPRFAELAHGDTDFDAIRDDTTIPGRAEPDAG